jgi:hypothetical protein
MSYLDTPVDGAAQADVNRICDSDRARLGYLPNYARVFGRRPAAEPDSHYRTSLEPESCGSSPSGDPSRSTTAQSRRSEEKSSTDFLGS